MYIYIFFQCLFLVLNCLNCICIFIYIYMRRTMLTYSHREREREREKKKRERERERVAVRTKGGPYSIACVGCYVLHRGRAMFGDRIFAPRSLECVLAFEGSCLTRGWDWKRTCQPRPPLGSPQPLGTAGDSSKSHG